MTKRGRPYKSQPESSEATKNRRVEFDEAVDDVIPISLAHKLRQRLAEEKAKSSSANEDVEKKKPRGKKADHLYCRQNPTEFISCIQSLTPRQKESVNELGFGPVLDFNIREIPGYLAYRVLKSFNLARSEIPLSGGERLILDDEDVHLTLGFPRGPTPIARKEEYQTNFEFNDIVVARCGKTRYQLNATDVAQMMKDETDGGLDFKRLFMFLLENALIETPSYGNCKPKILHFIDDVDEIANMNWCGYVLSILEATYPSWDKGSTAYFTGPIHFLLCAYVDRVVHIRRRVMRAWPSIKGWTAETLKQREEVEINQFGTGRLEDRIDKQKYLIDEEARRVEAVNRGDGRAPSSHRAKIIRDRFVASSALMGHAISRWVDDFKQIPVELLDDGCFRVGSQIGFKLLGMEDEKTVEDEEIVTTLTQAREDEEEYSPEWITEMEKMMQANDNKKTITRGFDRPSFVLDGFDCPDPFATPPSKQAEGSGRGDDDKNGEETEHDGRGDDQQGGATLEDQSNVHNSVGGSGTESGTSGIGVPFKTGPSELRGESEGGSKHEAKAAKNKVERGEIQADKTDKPIKEVATKEGKGKRAAVTKKTARGSEKGIEIGVVKTSNQSEGVAGKGGRGKGLDIPDDDLEGEGKGKEIEQEMAGHVAAGKLATSRFKKASLAARSPFNERAVRLTAKPNHPDKELYYWVLSTAETSKDTVVYEDDCIKTVQLEFASLAQFKPVSPAIVDTWSAYLNNMEKLKAPETVSRVFFSTKPCRHTVIEHPAEWSEEQARETFWTRMFDDVLGTGIFKWDTYDIFFFPVWGSTHQYLVCFDLPDGNVNIIDHTLPESHSSFNAKYGKTPLLLKKFFADALVKLKAQQKAAQVRKCKIHVVTMAWRINYPSVETGVYIMRHMETYFGGKDKDWQCGFSGTGTKNQEIYRIKVANALLTSPNNSVGATNQSNATKFWKERPPRFNFEKWVEEYGLE